MRDTETKALSILELERTHSGSKSPLGFPQPALAPFSGRCLTKNRLWFQSFPGGREFCSSQEKWGIISNCFSKGQQFSDLGQEGRRKIPLLILIPDRTNSSPYSWAAGLLGRGDRTAAKTAAGCGDHRLIPYSSALWGRSQPPGPARFPTFSVSTLTLRGPLLEAPHVTSRLVHSLGVLAP